MSKMLCCGGEKDTNRELKSAQNTPSRQPINMPYGQQMGMKVMAPPPLAGQQQPGQMPLQQQPPPGQQGMMPPMTNQALVQGGGHQPGRIPVPAFDHRDEFKKPNGISEEVFRQLETVQNRYDSKTAAAFSRVQKSGEMNVRLLDPREFIWLANETAPKINIENSPDSATSFVEIVKRPGQTLGLYIREGNGVDRGDGVFISRIAVDSAVYSSGCLQLGDEILAVNLVDVTRMSLDDVVIIMSIPRRLVLTTKRGRGGGNGNGNRGNGGGFPVRQNGNGMLDGKATPPVVVYKQGGGGADPMYPEGGNGGPGMPLDSPPSRSQYFARDSRTLTWDRNPKPDRSDPKYFPVNSLPRQSPHQANYLPVREDPGMPPPMRELSTGYPPMTTPVGQGAYPPQQQQPGYFAEGTPTGSAGPEYYAEGEMGPPGRGQRLLHRMASEPSARYGAGMVGGRQPIQSPSADRRYSTLQYPSRGHYPPRNSFSGVSGVGPPPRSRHHSGLDYASDTEALHSPAGGMASMRMSRTNGRGGGGSLTGVPVGSSRSSSLPRTFQREALLRHPELSMEMDRLADPAVLSGLSTDDQLSDSGAISAPESVITARKRGYRSPSFSGMGADAYRSSRGHSHGGGGFGLSNSASTHYGGGYKDMRRTPSTSAIYETLRKSKELRESLSRPSSRLSMDNEKIGSRDSDTQYYSDSEHQMISTSYAQRESRRIRNRTLSGIESARMLIQQRPTSAQGGSRAITPSFTNDKENGHNFVDFNPADFIKYKSEVMPDTGGVRLSGLLNLHLLAGRGLRTGGRTRRIRDLYCVVEVDHIHKARTVVRSGGINFDWDERFDLDMANSLEVEFLIYSWDPQLRHRLCYRSSLRLATLFGKGQTFQQVALRLHPAGTLYLTLTYLDLSEAYDRRRYCLPEQILFGQPLEDVITREASGFLVPILVKRCVDEVERRGLDIIGIYRLCGADTKKNILRQAFEDSPEIVDLTSENVPDINVITGLLKEYMRELPTPVFSHCLYQMLVDAMGVFLPDDPDGNAKLVFSILDCLPKANRNCLVHIMDHLSRVSAQASRNKMNSQNLSLCFAPVLMMDFSHGANSASIPNISEPIQILKYLIEIWPKSPDGV